MSNPEDNQPQQLQQPQDETLITTPLTRDEIRAKVLGAKPLVKVVEDFFGVTVELRQPDLGTILNAREEDQSNQVTRMLTDFTFVPGTEEKVFEPADADALIKLPFGPPMQRFIDSMNEILGVDAGKLEAAVKDATKSG